MDSSPGTKLASCHGRFCRYSDTDGNEFLPTSNDCSDLKAFVSDIFVPAFQTIMRACCTIQCDDKKVNTNLVLALQCQGASSTAAVTIWIATVAVVVSGFLHLLGRMLERGTRKFSAIGALALNVAVTYIVVIFSTDLVDTILYPIVAGMDIAIFCYFFSGFQYGIGLVYEAGPIVLVSFYAIPLYRSITSPNTDNGFPDPTARVARAEAISMLCLTIVWVMHSVIYRTITYRSLWIQAWKKQKSDSGSGQQSDNNQARSRNRHMSRLWFLAAGQGQPTWHTTVGKSVGFLNVILAWRIVIECNKFLSTTCQDNYAWFRFMLYVPPVLLTVAVVSTNIQLLRFAVVDFVETTQGSQGSQAYCGVAKSLKESLTLQNRPSVDCVIEATTAYRLGRNSLYVEPRECIELFENKYDKYVGRIIYKLHFGLLLLFYIPNAIIMTSHQCLLWIWLTINKCIQLTTAHDVGPEEEFSKWSRREKPSAKEKCRAYEILVKYCGVDGVPTCEVDGEQTHEIKDLHATEQTIRDILREHQKHINLPLVLDETGPSALLYLLILLDEVLEL